MKFRRKLYTRGSSFETTIPKPLLFALDQDKKHDVLFVYDAKKKQWCISFEERSSPKKQSKKKS